MKQSQRLVKNILAGGISLATGGLLQLGTVVLIARWLSVAQFGRYAFMVSLGFILQRLADMGVSSIIMRDMAVQPRRIGELLAGALSIAWLVTSAIAFLMLGVIVLGPFSRSAGVLTAIMGLAGLTQFHCACYGSVLLSQEDNELQALGFFLHKVCLLVTVFAALKAGFGLAGVVVAHLLSSVFQWRFYRWIIVKQYARPRLSWDPVLWRRIVLDSVPMGAANVVRLLSEQADIMVLTLLTNLRTVGFFCGPYRIASGLRFLPLAMVIPLFPVYSRAAIVSDGRPQFRNIYERGMRAFLLFAFPFALLFVFAPVTLTTGLLGVRYLPAAPAMRLLGLAVLLIFIGSPFPFLLTALGQQSFLFFSSASAFILRVALDFAFTPKFGFLGPCWSLIVSETFLIAIWICRLWFSGFPLALGEILWRPCLAGLLVAATIHFCHASSLFSLFPFAIISVAVYALVIVKLGAISEDELQMGREGVSFVRSLLAQWSRQLRSRP